MKRIFVYITILSVLAGITCLAAVKSQAQPVYTYVTVYSVVGTCTDSQEAGTPVLAEGRMVVFYKNLVDYNNGIYTFDFVGLAGSAKTANQYRVNATSNLSLPLVVGDTYYAAVVKGVDGYGADGVPVTISGKGYDVANLTLRYCGGPQPPTGMQPPIIKEVWFGNRLYQKELVEKAMADPEDDFEFVVSPTPRIRAVIEGQGTSGINASSISIIVNKDTAQAVSIPIQPSHILQTLYAADAPDVIQAMTVEYAIPEDRALPDGENTVTVRAFEASNTVSTDEVCYVRVYGGPLGIRGPVVVYPSPFDIPRHGRCEIQYTLNADANIDIYIYSVAGVLAKKLMLSSGAEGGSAGINKVPWDGITETGLRAGNGVYVGTIIFRDENKLLARFKFSILSTSQSGGGATGAPFAPGVQ